jgi:hypothetical protein
MSNSDADSNQMSMMFSSQVDILPGLIPNAASQAQAKPMHQYLN